MAEPRPPHPDTAVQTTEFGSKLFHDKIEQHHQNHQHHDSTHHDHAEPTGPVATGSRFILPLRESKTVEVEPVKPDHKREKRGFFNLRHKVSLLHSRSSHETPDVPLPTASIPLPIPATTPSAESKIRISLPLEQQFLALPNELQSHVLTFLPLSDILNLRLASKSWNALVAIHETPIVRHHLDQYIPAYARRLYPLTDSSDLNFGYICGLWHRLHVAAKLSYMISEWITKDIFLRQTDAQRLAFAPQHERMRRRLIPLVFTAFHFFETYRKLHLRYVERNGHGLKREAYTINPIEKEIMDMYDDQTLLRVHEVFPLIISSFCRRLRPPTYVGRVERSIRGYIREKPSDEVHVAILCIGGMRQVERLWEIKGYNSRRAAVDSWHNSLVKDTPSELPTTKTRRSLMSFGRKKSVGGEPRDSHRDHQSSSLYRTRSPTGSLDGVDAAAADTTPPHPVFSTTLSAGAPMGTLAADQAQALLNDLPVLQQIWMTTAEAIILNRNIVQKTQDIKRNQQLMLHLIRDDELDEEDEWAYGRKLHDSVRPPANTIHDDDAD